MLAKKTLWASIGLAALGLAMTAWNSGSCCGWRQNLFVVGQGQRLP